MAAKSVNDRPVLATYASWDELQREVFDKCEWRPPTPDDVSRVTLDGPPATPEQIRELFALPLPDDFT